MKKIFLIIGMAAVMSNATSYTAEKHLDRITTALERIASALEKNDRNCESRTIEIPVYVPQEPMIKKTYTPKVNGRSLKAVPSNDVFIEDEDEISTEDCVEKCWNKPLNNQIKTCIDKCIKEITK